MLQLKINISFPMLWSLTMTKKIESDVTHYTNHLLYKLILLFLSCSYCFINLYHYEIIIVLYLQSFNMLLLHSYKITIGRQ